MKMSPWEIFQIKEFIRICRCIDEKKETDPALLYISEAEPTAIPVLLLTVVVMLYSND